MPKCQYCGYLGDDVHLWGGYVGGQGYVQRFECDDRVKCWHRWDKEKYGKYLNEGNDGDIHNNKKSKQ